MIVPFSSETRLSQILRELVDLPKEAQGSSFRSHRSLEDGMICVAISLLADRTIGGWRGSNGSRSPFMEATKTETRICWASSRAPTHGLLSRSSIFFAVSAA
ncbi:hypothetical protein GW17_00015126 [Ensete ventricosum]|uniref:Uncharacterized protein n=1 Tax=Ensete ventricosum TaxID=4639 RepID=A0A444FDL7_ENSVE|nr:hypothetical protein GW17_00015126 [Ensete ventricosum]RZR75025.1 hypothetical protein BHM03_00047927 [Ensete ventricosum]